ncbi:hypothetical protein GW17_00014535 [Ensete ventricosum]|nr:hypothetical protein GW17_00014535 [Ensete ventricosum]RZS04114.1 hypothetical protein BHM03_00034397 [Ensete ventricosum]
MKVTISSSIELMLLNRALYACNLFYVNNELKSFRSCLRWMCVDQFNTKHAIFS